MLCGWQLSLLISYRFRFVPMRFNYKNTLRACDDHDDYSIRDIYDGQSLCYLLHDNHLLNEQYNNNS